MLKFLLSSAVAVFAQANGAPPSETIAGILQLNAYDFSGLNFALKVANLTAALDGPGPLTLLAPSNKAFDKIFSRSALATLLQPANKDELVKVLTYHVLPKAYQFDDFKDHSVAATLEGEEIDIFAYTDPPAISFNMQGSTYPKDFRNASNGAILIINDGILVPSAIQPNFQPNVFQPTVVEIVTGHGYSTISTLLEAAGLLPTLGGKGPWTVFSPTDDAFAKLDQSLLLHLLDPANIKDLQAVLTYHVVPAKSITADGDVKTAEGQTVSVTATSDGKVTSVNNIATGLAFFNATNGGVVSLEGVLVPPSLKELFAKYM